MDPDNPASKYSRYFIIFKNGFQEERIIWVCFEAKARPEKKAPAFLFEEINALKRKLKPENTSSSKKRKAESLLSIDINLTTSDDEGDYKEYLFIFPKPFSSDKIIYQNHLIYQSSIELVVSLIVKYDEHLLRALADTGASRSIMLEACNSAPCNKTDDSNTTTWSTIGDKFTTNNTGICL
jgi:hypothetical protein